MKLNDYIKHLQKLEEKHGDLEVVYSSDDEGNSYHSVYNTGTIGQYKARDNNFTDDSQAEWFEKEYEEKFIVNAVCIN